MGFNGIAIPAATLSAVKNAVLKNPKLPYPMFIKDNPKARISSNSFLRARYKYVSEAGREDELPLKAGHDKPSSYAFNKEEQKRKYTRRSNTLYSTGWRYPVEEFKKDPLKGLQDFVETLSQKGRANFELLKIEVNIDSKWVPHLEVRELS